MIEYYWIAAIGLCFILKYGSILESFREITSSRLPFLKKLYQCCLCMGFWVGLLFCPLLFLDGISLWKILVFPFSCSCVCWFADSIITQIHKTTNYLSSSEDSTSNK